MNQKILIIIVVAAVVLIGGYFVIQNLSQPSTQTSLPATTSNQTGSQNTTPSQTNTAQQSEREITITGTEFSFSPANITLKAGEKVKLSFNNDGNYPHNWVIEGKNITTKTIPGGAGDVIEFTAPPAGTYSIYCSVDSHRAKGMGGTLTVQ